MLRAMTGGSGWLAIVGVLTFAALHACGASHQLTPPIDAAGSDAAMTDAAADAEGPVDAAPDSPNLVPGDCVFSDNMWYCGSGFGTYTSCPGGGAYPLLGTTCDFDSGVCFGCDHGVGATFGCVFGSYTFGASNVANQCNH
jgi:hypothetical protein